jgi:hypothetical protein
MAWAASEWSSETSATPLLTRRFSSGLVVDVPVQHGGPCSGLLMLNVGSVFGQQGHGQVVPAVARIQQAVGVVLRVVLAGEEHQQTALDGSP